MYASTNLGGLPVLGLSSQIVDNVKGTVISKCLSSARGVSKVSLLELHLSERSLECE